jgi:hypothetical protein
MARGAASAGDILAGGCWHLEGGRAVREDQDFPPHWLQPGTADPGEVVPGPWDGDSPRDALRWVVRELSSGQLTCWARLRSGELGEAVVFRAWPARALHVVGASPLAGELRRLVAAGEAPGWELHPVPGGRTALHALVAPLRRMTGGGRVYNVLDRSGFAFVEEVAATPDACLLDLRNSGPKLVAVVRQAIGELAPGTAALAGSAGPGGQEAGPPPPPALGPGIVRAIQVVAAWAVAEQGAVTAGDLLAVPAATQGLPPDVTAAWDQVRDLDLRLLAGRMLPDAGLAGLAAELLAEVDQRRQLILTARTFAPPPRRTYDSLAAGLGVTRERVRQLEADALGKLAQAAADDRYAPLRWRAASPAAAPGAVTDAPPWMEHLLAWLPGGTA